MTEFAPLSGACLCGGVGYEVIDDPLTLYACHCTDCQTASGASFTLVMVVPSSAVRVRRGEPEAHERPRADGRTKNILRCPGCLTALWGVRPDVPDFATVYAGTLDDSASLDPVGHIWTRSAQPWISLPEGELCFERQPPDLAPFVRAWRARSRSVPRSAR